MRSKWASFRTIWFNWFLICSLCRDSMHEELLMILMFIKRRDKTACNLSSCVHVFSYNSKNMFHFVQRWIRLCFNAIRDIMIIVIKAWDSKLNITKRTVFSLLMSIIMMISDWLHVIRHKLIHWTLLCAMTWDSKSCYRSFFKLDQIQICWWKKRLKSSLSHFSNSIFCFK